MIQRVKRIAVLVLPMVLFPAIWVSCDIAEPEPIKGDSPPVPPVYAAPLISIQGERLTGIIDISLPDSLRTPGITSIDFYLDSLPRALYVQPDAVIQIDLTTVPDGDHLLSIFVHDEGQIKGMLGLLNAPDKIFAMWITVDNTPPSAVQNLAVQWNTSPAVTWQPVPDLNFHAYIVRRHDPDLPSSFVAVDTIFSKSTVSFTDTSLGPVYGLRGSYSIATWNRAAFAESGIVSAMYGIPFPVSGAFFSAANPVLDEIYILSSSGVLAAVSTQTNTLLRSIMAEGFWWGSGNRIAVSEDGTKLFHWKVTPGFPDTAVSVVVYNTSNLTVSTQWTPSFPLREFWPFTAGKGNSLFVVDKGGKVRRVDGLTGAVGDSTAQVVTLPDVVMKSSPDRNGLIILERGHPPVFSCRLVSVDISSGLPVAGQARAFASDSYLSTFEFHPNSSSLFILFAYVFEGILVADVSTLGTISSYDYPSDDRVGISEQALAVSDSLIYVEYFRTNGVARVAELNGSTGSVLRSWDFAEYVTKLHRTQNGKFLYALSSFGFGPVKDWVIPLQ